MTNYWYSINGHKVSNFCLAPWSACQFELDPWHACYVEQKSSYSWEHHYLVINLSNSKIFVTDIYHFAIGLSVDFACDEGFSLILPILFLAHCVFQIPFQNIEKYLRGSILSRKKEPEIFMIDIPLKNKVSFRQGLLIVLMDRVNNCQWDE